MLFALVAHDRANKVSLRMELRPNHLIFLEGLGDQLRLAGPFLDEDGNMVGSIVVIEAETLDAARATFARDPFAIGGLFEQTAIKPWKIGVNNTLKA